MGSKRGKPAPARESKAESWTKTIVQLAVVVLVALAARSSLADHYVIPSGSMLPTLEIKDRVFVGKARYGLRIPFSSITIAGDKLPERGDVVVFRSPTDGSVFITSRHCFCVTEHSPSQKPCVSLTSTVLLRSPITNVPGGQQRIFICNELSLRSSPAFVPSQLEAGGEVGTFASPCCCLAGPAIAALLSLAERLTFASCLSSRAAASRSICSISAPASLGRFHLPSSTFEPAAVSRPMSFLR